MNNKTRKMTEGAVITAIVGVFLLINRQMMGMLEGYLFWILPLPTLIYAAKYGWKDALIPFIAIVLLSLIVSLPTTSFLVFIYGMTGLVYGAGVKLGKPNVWLLFWTLLFTTVNYLTTMVLFASLFGYDLTAEAQYMISVLESVGYQGDPEVLAKLIKTVVPVSLFLSACLEVALVHILANFTLKRLKIRVNKLRALSEIKAPKWFGWLLLAIMVINASSGLWACPENFKDLLFSLDIIAKIVFMVFGVLNLLVFSRITGQRYLVFLTFFLMFLLPTGIMIIGILDIVTDYRERMIERNTNVTK